MATETAPLTLRVQRIDREDGLHIDVGTISFGPEGQLAVVAAEPHFDDYLAEVVNTVNAKKELRIKVPPPKGAQPYSIYTLSVTRAAPDLLDMMKQYLEQKFDLVVAEEK